MTDQAVDLIANGLYSVFRSLGVAPYMRVVNNDLSERVSRKLYALFSNGDD